MNWVKINDISEIPRCQLLFYSKDRTFFEGGMIDDDEYGPVIVLYETYLDPKEVTHYMIVEPPQF